MSLGRLEGRKWVVVPPHGLQEGLLALWTECGFSNEEQNEFTLQLRQQLADTCTIFVAKQMEDHQKLSDKLSNILFEVDELRADLEESGELSVAGETLLSAISLCEVENARLMEMALHVESETAVYAGRLQQVLSLFGSDDDAHSQSMKELEGMSARSLTRRGRTLQILNSSIQDARRRVRHVCESIETYKGLISDLGGSGDVDIEGLGKQCVAAEAVAASAYASVGPVEFSSGSLDDFSCPSEMDISTRALDKLDRVNIQLRAVKDEKIDQASELLYKIKSLWEMLEESEETVAQKTEQFQPLYSEEVFNMLVAELSRCEEERSAKLGSIIEKVVNQINDMYSKVMQTEKCLSVAQVEVSEESLENLQNVVDNLQNTFTENKKLYDLLGKRMAILKEFEVACENQTASLGGRSSQQHKDLQAKIKAENRMKKTLPTVISNLMGLINDYNKTHNDPLTINGQDALLALAPPEKPSKSAKPSAKPPKAEKRPRDIDATPAPKKGRSVLPPRTPAVRAAATPSKPPMPASVRPKGPSTRMPRPTFKGKDRTSPSPGPVGRTPAAKTLPVKTIPSRPPAVSSPKPRAPQAKTALIPKPALPNTQLPPKPHAIPVPAPAPMSPMDSPVKVDSPPPVHNPTKSVSTPFKACMPAGLEATAEEARMRHEGPSRSVVDRLTAEGYPNPDTSSMDSATFVRALEVEDRRESLNSMASYDSDGGAEYDATPI